MSEKNEVKPVTYVLTLTNTIVKQTAYLCTRVGATDFRTTQDVNRAITFPSKRAANKEVSAYKGLLANHLKVQAKLLIK